MQGELNDPSNIEIRIKEFILKDIGSGAYTEYEFGPEMVDLYEERPEFMEMKMGHMHTHHNMGVYFSGTDMRCLQDNVESMDFFLSVIVNANRNIIGKIAFKSKVKRNLSYIISRKPYDLTAQEEECMATYDCEILIPEELHKLDKEIEEIKKKKKKELEKLQKKNSKYQKKNDDNAYYRRFPATQKQIEMFEKEEIKEVEETIPDKNVDNAHLLTMESIENLLVRSITVNDLEASPLSQVVPRVREKLPDGDQSFYIDTMAEHFIDSVRTEYYDHQFRYVFRKSLELLNEYRFRFTSQLSYYINTWLDRIDSEEFFVNSNDSDDDTEYGSEDEAIVISSTKKTQTANEF